MKKIRSLSITSVLFLFCQFVVAAPSLDQVGLDELANAQNRVSHLLTLRNLNPNVKSELILIKDSLNRLQNVIGFGDNNNHHHGNRSDRSVPAEVSMFSSRDCSYGAVGIFTDRTDCSATFSLQTEVSSISSNGQCLVIKETNAINACWSFKPLGRTVPDSENYRFFFDASSCNANYLHTVIAPSTDCSSFSDSKTVQSYLDLREKKCFNIDDMKLNQACNAFKPTLINTRR
jgi:hypothetical protein